MNQNKVIVSSINNGNFEKDIIIDGERIHIELIDNIFNINDFFIYYFDIFNFKVLSESSWEYDGYINFSIKKSVVQIENFNNVTTITFEKAYFFEKIMKKGSSLFFIENNKKRQVKVVDVRNKEYFFNIGFDKYNLPYYINLSKKNYLKTIKTDLLNNNLTSVDMKKYNFISNQAIDLIPVFFKNESLFLIKDNKYLFDFLLKNVDIHRQDNNFFIFTKDLHQLIEEDNIILNNLEFFNYHDKNCFIEPGWEECVFYGKMDIENKNTLDVFKDNMLEIAEVFNRSEYETVYDNIFIPTEKNNETMFAHNVRVIVEDVIKKILNEDKLTNRRNLLLGVNKKEISEITNAELGKLTNKDANLYHSLINPLKNFRNMYSHDSKGSYHQNYEKNYKFVRIGNENIYKLNEEPSLNDYNFMSLKAIENLTLLLDEIVSLKL